MTNLDTNWFELEFDVTTPMFCGRGGNPNPGGDGFRVTELRGALRFWFRALAGFSFGNNICEIRRLETQLFGAASKVDKHGNPVSGMSPVELRLCKAPAVTSGDDPYIETILCNGVVNLDEDDDQLKSANKAPTPVNGIGYLAGPALYSGRNTFTRGLILPGTKGTLKVRLREKNDDVRQRYFGQLACSFWALATFGGIGARIRRGFGGIAFDNGTLARMSAAAATVDGSGGGSDDPLTVNGQQGFFGPERLTSVCEYFSKLIEADPLESPPSQNEFLAEFPMFGHDCHEFDVPSTQKTTDVWSNEWDVLKAIGWNYRDERAPGRRAKMANGSVGASSRRRYTELYAEKINTREANVDGASLKDNFAMGLPIPYRSDGKTSVVNAIGVDRRSSPVWFRPMKDNNGTWRIMTHVFYDRFLPEGTKIKLSNRDDKNNAPKETDVRKWFDKWIKRFA